MWTKYLTTAALDQVIPLTRDEKVKDLGMWFDISFIDHIIMPPPR